MSDGPPSSDAAQGIPDRYVGPGGKVVPSIGRIEYQVRDFLRRAPVESGHLRGGVAWIDGIDLQISFLLGKRAGEPSYAGLGRAIHRDPRVPVYSGLATHVQDRTLDQREHLHGHNYQAFQIGTHLAGDLLRRLVPQRFPDIDPGVVDQCRDLVENPL